VVSLWAVVVVVVVGGWLVGGWWLVVVMVVMDVTDIQCVCVIGIRRRRWRNSLAEVVVVVVLVLVVINGLMVYDGRRRRCSSLSLSEDSHDDRQEKVTSPGARDGVSVPELEANPHKVSAPMSQ